MKGYYPAGAYDDPRAPWNEGLYDEVEEDEDDWDKEEYLHKE